MILRIEDLFMDIICRTTIRIFDVTQHGHHSLVVLSVLKLRKSLDVLENEHLGLSNFDVLVQLEK